MGGAAYDLAVIGGGINGCGVARDAQGRGLRVFLAEQGDLAGATSSASTKLIHGGLRYLEFYEFRLVREALFEREVLLASAPHIVRPLRFVLPHHRGLRPWPVIRLGLFLYDHIGGRRLLPATRSVNLRTDMAGTGLKKNFTAAFEYSDCWVEDARLVVLNARDAANRGAEIRTRTKCVTARREGDHWRLTLEDQRDRKRFDIVARALVNASGPWVAPVIAEVVAQNTAPKVRLVKGSHIVVKRLFEHDRAYIFQNADRRIVFAIPFERDFTLIGTTDEDFVGDPASVKISERETGYLLDSISAYLERPLSPDMIRWSYSGVRPLFDDGASKAQEATRDYALQLDMPEGQPPLVSILGGKITTYRRVSEAVLARLAAFFPEARAPWTRTAILPGGDIPVTGVAEWEAEEARRYSFLAPDLVRRLCRAYGTRIAAVLGGATSAGDLGRDFGAGLSRREVDYLMAEEWAETAEDILWRRSRLGLRYTPAETAALDTHVRSARRPTEMAVQ